MSCSDPSSPGISPSLSPALSAAAPGWPAALRCFCADGSYPADSQCTPTAGCLDCAEPGNDRQKRKTEKIVWHCVISELFVVRDCVCGAVCSHWLDLSPFPVPWFGWSRTYSSSAPSPSPAGESSPSAVAAHTETPTVSIAIILL